MEALTSGGIKLEEKISQTPSGKEIFACQKNGFFALLHPKPNCPDYRFLSAEKSWQLHFIIIKDSGSFWMTANTFGIHQCTVSKTIVEVFKTINAILSPDYMHLPRFETVSSCL